MSAFAGNAGVGTGSTAPGRDDDGIPGLDPVDWGFVLRSSSPLRRTLLRMAEAAVGAVGLGLILMAVAQWVLPGAVVTGDVLGHKAAVSAFLAMPGLLLLHYAGQGFQTEVHLDRVRGEVRIVASNRARQVRLLDSIAFGEIAALEVARAGDGPVVASARGRLLVHLVHGDEPLALVSGTAARLSQVAAVFARDIEREMRHAAAPSADLGRVTPDLA